MVGAIVFGGTNDGTSVTIVRNKTRVMGRDEVGAG